MGLYNKITGLLGHQYNVSTQYWFGGRTSSAGKIGHGKTFIMVFGVKHAIFCHVLCFRFNNSLPQSLAKYNLPFPWGLHLSRPWRPPQDSVRRYELSPRHHRAGCLTSPSPGPSVARAQSSPAPGAAPPMSGRSSTTATARSAGRWSRPTTTTGSWIPCRRRTEGSARIERAQRWDGWGWRGRG